VPHARKPKGTETRRMGTVLEEQRYRRDPLRAPS